MKCYVMSCHVVDEFTLYIFMRAVGLAIITKVELSIPFAWCSECVCVCAVWAHSE